MMFQNWRSVRIIVGGGVLALLIAVWGIVDWGVPFWFIHLVAIIFIFSSAILHEPRLYLAIAAAYILAHVGMHLLHPGRGIFAPATDGVQWLSIILAGGVIHQLSSQRRRTETISRQRIRELEMMNETLTDISGELDLNTLLQTITERAVRLLDVSLGELVLHDQQTGELEIVAQYPLTQSQVGFKMKLGEGAMGRVAVTRRPLILNDYKDFVNALEERFTTGVEATMDVPLLRGDEFIGVLGVARHDRHRKFTNADLSLLTVFANQATVAIENARLYREVQHLAFTDGLTGIPNRRRLFELFDREYKRALRYARPLSFMLMDIDHFKRINDTHGHTAGDEVLRWFAQTGAGLVRQKIDVIGRFGGEEFAIIYPETDLPSALSAAERLRVGILGSRVRYGELEIPITFSAGIVSLPLEKPPQLDQLVERADRALYFSKQTRNRISYWDDASAGPIPLDPS